jgi:iron complex outermembrane recepter protein
MQMRSIARLLALGAALSLIQAVPVFALAVVGDQSNSANQTDTGQSAPPTSPDAAATQAAPPARGAGRSQDSGGLAEIIVTARRVEERVQDVPISITVFNQQQLSDRNVVNAQDLAAFTPSLSTNTNFGSQNSSFAIRGFVQDIGTQPAVGVYFADVVAPRGASNNTPIGDGAGPGTFFDLQNVQVLKGPQGTLFGRNTTGGAILLVPQKPTSQLEGYVEGSYGNYDMKRIQAVVNVPLSEAVRFRIGVDRQTRDGYLTNDSGYGPLRLGDVDYTSLRASLVVDITPDLENYSIASFSRSEPNGDVQKLIACDPSLSPANLFGQLACAQIAQEQAKGAGFYTVQNGDVTNPSTDLTQWQIINTTTWHTSDTLTVKNILSYAQLKEYFTSALFGTNFHLILPPFFPPPGVPINFVNLTPIPGGPTADESTATEEMQLQGRAADNRLNWQAGAYTELVDPLALSGSQSPGLLDCTNSTTFNCLNPLGTGFVNYTAARTAFRNFGLYEQTTYSLTDVLKLTEGFRYTWDRVRNDSNLITYTIQTPGVGQPLYCTNTDLSLPACFVRYREGSSAPTWLLDLDYIPTDDILLYGKYSRGYRAGGISAASPTVFALFKPEKVDTYETGIKTSFRGPVSGTFNVAAFYNDFRNQQLQLDLNPKPGATVTPASGIYNAGKSQIYGLEVETAITPFSGLTLEAAYTYLNTKIQQVAVAQLPADNPYVVDSPARPGDPLPLSPKNKFTATGTYTLPLGQDIGRISLGVTFTHTDSMLVNYSDRTSQNPAIVPLSFLPALNLLNLNLSWNSIAASPVDLALFATNITQKNYYTYVPGIYNTIGFETAELGQPRMFGARLRYSFGGQR